MSDLAYPRNDPLSEAPKTLKIYGGSNSVARSVHSFKHMLDAEYQGIKNTHPLSLKSPMRVINTQHSELRADTKNAGGLREHRIEP